MAFDKFKGILGGTDDDGEVDVTGTDDEFYSTSREEFHDNNGMAGSKMMLLEPRAYSESQQIADYLKNRSAVVVNLKRVTPDQGKRIVDFLSGTLYAIVEGKISDDATTKPAKSKKTKDDDDEFDW